MVSNLSCLGFSVANEDELQTLVLKLASSATTGLSCQPGDYRIWRSRTGAELWFHLTGNDDASQPEDEREIVGLTPFFEGKSEVKVNLTGHFQRDGDTPFEGALQGWVIDPSAEETDDLEDGSYPLIFDSADFGALDTDSLPARQNVRLTGFAREIVAYENEDEFEKAQEKSPHPLASKAFFPVGMFAAASGEKPTPSSHAMFSGTIVETHELTNEETSQTYHWLLVDSLDATFDVVADPECVTGNLKAGAVVQIACWMFGRLLLEG